MLTIIASSIVVAILAQRWKHHTGILWFFISFVCGFFWYFMMSLALGVNEGRYFAATPGDAEHTGAFLTLFAINTLIGVVVIWSLPTKNKSSE